MALGGEEGDSDSARKLGSCVSRITDARLWGGRPVAAHHISRRTHVARDFLQHAVIAFIQWNEEGGRRARPRYPMRDMGDPYGALAHGRGIQMAVLSGNEGKIAEASGRDFYTSRTTTSRC